MPAIVLFGLVLAAVIIVSWWRIFTRMGMPTVLALLMPIPFGSTVVLLYTAFSRWPIEDRSGRGGVAPCSYHFPNGAAAS